MSGVRNSKKIITCKIFITCSISRVVMWTRMSSLKCLPEGLRELLLSQGVILGDAPKSRSNPRRCRDEHGPYILSSMNEYHESMIRDFEKDIGSSLTKMFSTPGAAVTPPLCSTPEDQIILNEESTALMWEG